jgi:hypothetical protein
MVRTTPCHNELWYGICVKEWSFTPTFKNIKVIGLSYLLFTEK